MSQKSMWAPGAAQTQNRGRSWLEASDAMAIKLDNLHPGDSPLGTGGPWVTEVSGGKAQMPAASIPVFGGLRGESSALTGQ